MSEILKLRQYCYSVYKTLLKAHIKAQNLVPSVDEQICVKAFCVLSHAALEEYFEELAKTTLANAYLLYKTEKVIKNIPTSQAEIDGLNKVINQMIKTLILSSGYTIFTKNHSDAFKTHKAKIDAVSSIFDNDGGIVGNKLTDLTKKTKSYTKDVLVETTGFFNSTLKENHGTSLKYLMKLLIPVGIDVPDHGSFINSLQKLAKYRGEYAHSAGNITELISPTDIARYLIDTVKLCGLITSSIKEFSAYPA